MKIVPLCILAVVSFSFGSVHAGHVKRLNQNVCDILRLERRKHVYDAVGIDKMDVLRKKVLSKATEKEVSELKDAAEVPDYDIFFPSDESLRAAKESNKKFVEIGEGILDRFGTFVDGVSYKRASGIEDDEITRHIRQFSQNEKYAETILFRKPSIQIGRKFLNPSLLKVDFLNQYQSLIFVIEQPLYSQGSPEPKVVIYAQSGSESLYLSLSELIELSLPESCKNPDLYYDQSFNGIQRDAQVSEKSTKPEQLDSGARQKTENGESRSGTLK